MPLTSIQQPIQQHPTLILHLRHVLQVRSAASLAPSSWWLNLHSKNWSQAWQLPSKTMLWKWQLWRKWYCLPLPEYLPNEYIDHTNIVHVWNSLAFENQNQATKAGKSRYDGAASVGTRLPPCHSWRVWVCLLEASAFTWQTPWNHLKLASHQDSLSLRVTPPVKTLHYWTKMNMEKVWMKVLFSNLLACAVWRRCTVKIVALVKAWGLCVVFANLSFECKNNSGFEHIYINYKQSPHIRRCVLY